MGGGIFVALWSFANRQGAPPTPPPIAPFWTPQSAAGRGSRRQSIHGRIPNP